MSTVYHRPADPSGDDSYVRPLFADRCQAGFPSPATDYAEQELDLNSYCISRPAATFFLRASGESMNQAGVQNGDLLIVDRAEKPQHGDIVIAEMKAGVMLADFTPSGIAQPGLFDEIQPHKNSEKLMKTLDELNQSGKGKVWFAGRGTAPEWQMKREMLSQCYTTKWRDIPLARLG
ncbi:TPA: DUF4113 domain-containing protein [Escherichia coli]|nr:DUF4113 domain-containing protein [Escherichia coli]HBA6950903.1 DUF4113 domain-containing protein [Escherichia coli]HBA7007161.1 DUF4113 domain-containing protein [Escherichia coli]HBA7957654.1 DUF4113 domain-containing protein [Escherichia coli]HBA8243458.1 DUF4113 domain-containing protein [Escherichia coli]